MLLQNRSNLLGVGICYNSKDSRYLSVSNITIHCVRHAQGYHNLSVENQKLRDPSLTPLGEAQCTTLQNYFPYHDKVTHLVSSPLIRTLYTCLLAFTPEVKAGKKVIALPELQETSDLPCDTGSEPENLREQIHNGPWREAVDLSYVQKGWNDKSPQTKWAPGAHRVEARAREARRWLRDLGMQYGGNADIVVVTHGGFLHYFTEDWTGLEASRGTGWDNTEFRSYKFRSDTDEAASIVETAESFERRAPTKPLSADEERQLKATSQPMKL